MIIIKTQSDNQLIKVDNIYFREECYFPHINPNQINDPKTKYGQICYNIETLKNDFRYYLGEYKTKKRAQQVLNNIEKSIINKDIIFVLPQK